MLDNASTSEERDAIRKAVSNAGFPIELFRVEKNIGFAGAHNFLFEKHKTESDFVALLNDDAILEPTYLEKLIDALETNPELASVSGIVYRWDFDKRDEPSKGKTNIIDTRGLFVSMTGAVSDIDAGNANETTTPCPLLKEGGGISSGGSKFEFVFGVSGCLPCYRVSALDQVSLEGTLFDSSFVIYKEDVELAFRLHAAGYKAATIPDAIAYHRRSMGRGVKRPVSSETKYQSYRNHLWTHLMHTHASELFSNRCLLLPYECLKVAYWLIRKPNNLSMTFRETKQQWKNLMRKRQFDRVVHDATAQRTKRGLTQKGQGTPPITRNHFDADIVVVMVSHNDLSQACLQSFVDARARTSLNIKLVVADNNSNKYAANEFVEPIVPDAIVLLRHEDHGYGRSCNRAARELYAKDYFILNPDTVLTDLDLFEKFHAFMEANPQVGIVAPKIYYLDGRLQETCRRFPAWYVPFVTRTRIEQTAIGKKYMHQFAMRDYDHETKRDVDWVQGSAMFVCGDLWRTLDGFDDRYWLYFEDTDLCRRVHLAGKQIIYDPQTTLQHAHGKESATYSNMLMNLLKKKEARGHIISWIKYMMKWHAKREIKN